MGLTFWQKVISGHQTGRVPVTMTNPLPVQQPGYSYLQTVVDIQVKAGAGFLHNITFSQADAAPTAGTIIVYDSLTEAAPIIFSSTWTTAVFSPATVTIDAAFTTGLYIGFTTTGDISVTVSYQ